MNFELARKLQGKQIKIEEMRLTSSNDKLNMFWNVVCCNKFLGISFYNISRLQLKSWSNPVIIQGFEIIDHYHEQWDSVSRYEIKDFEYDIVSFFCEELEVSE